MRLSSTRDIICWRQERKCLLNITVRPLLGCSIINILSVLKYSDWDECQAGDIWAQACDAISSPIVHWFKIHTGTLGIISHVFIILREMIMAFIFSGNRVALSFWWLEWGVLQLCPKREQTRNYRPPKPEEGSLPFLVVGWGVSSQQYTKPRSVALWVLTFVLTKNATALDLPPPCLFMQCDLNFTGAQLLGCHPVAEPEVNSRSFWEGHFQKGDFEEWQS